MKSSPRKGLLLSTCALLLAISAAGCDLFTQIFGQTADVPIVVNGSILLIMQNESGVPVDVDASFSVSGVVVRETRRALAASGLESVKSILRTTAERIEVVARVGAAGNNASPAVGTILKQATYLLDVDYADGGTIYFVVPAPDEVPNPDPNPDPGCADLEPPEVTCPENLTLSCEDSNMALENPGLPIATGTDDCDTDLNIASTDEVSGDSCVKLITRTWTATDELGKSDSCQQAILIVDETPPVLKAPDDAVIECGDDTSPATTGLLTADDACNVLLQQPTYTDHTPFGSCPIQFQRTWVASDACGNTVHYNQLITLVDTTPPQIDSCPSDDALVADSGCSIAAPDYRPQLLATDVCTSQPVVEQSPAPGAMLGLGDTEIIFTVRDDCQNETTCSIHVIVTSPDTDGDSVDDCADQCPGYDDTIDCNDNGVPDGCDIADCDGAPACSDCNSNGVPDECDITNCVNDPACNDCDQNGVPDGCEYSLTDCNNNGLSDACELSAQLMADCNDNKVPDSCDIAACVSDPACSDCDDNGVPDGCEYVLTDCNANYISDECEIAAGLAPDVNENTVPDECDETGDFNGDGMIDGEDVVEFILCYLESSTEGLCAFADLDNDGDIDDDDLHLFVLLLLDP